MIGVLKQKKNTMTTHNVFKQRVSQYKENKYKKENNINTCLSFSPFLPKFAKYVPGLIKGTYYGLTSYTNVGKTVLAKFLFVLVPLYWASKGTKVKIFYFCLEESREQFYDSMVTSQLYINFKKEISQLDLNSMFDNALDDSTLKQIEALDGYFEWFEQHVEVISHVRNPTGIYKIIREYAKQNGKFYYKGIEVDEGGDRYVPNDPDEYVIVVTDHINLLSPEKGAETLREAMQRHSTDYMLERCVNAYNYIVCDVHQQSAEGENADFNKFNNNEASITTLGNNKELSRNYMVLFSLNMPQRYNIKNHRGVDIQSHGGTMYRGFHILKNRFGPSSIFCPTNINPFAQTFIEV